MSKEAVRKLVEGRLASSQSLMGHGDEQSHPNVKNKPIPTSGRWPRLHDIELVPHRGQVSVQSLYEVHRCYCD
jgi:hypothetical protein